MIEFEKADHQKYSANNESLETLYLNAFTKGVSAQHITPNEAENYLASLFANGYAIFGFNQQKLVAALIATPLSFDEDCPEQIKDKYKNNETLYIAEVLVDQDFRGKGLGNQLMQNFEKKLDSNIKNIVLRVWNKNEAAVKLYEKAGYKTCGNIIQEKTRPNSTEKFTMHKNYMLKSL